MYHSLDSLSSKLGLPRCYLRQLADAGLIPCLRPGGRRRFDVDAVKEALRLLSMDEAGAAIAERRAGLAAEREAAREQGERHENQ